MPLVADSICSGEKLVKSMGVGIEKISGINIDRKNDRQGLGNVIIYVLNKCQL